MTCMPLFLSRHELWPNLNAYVVMSLSPPRVGSASGRCWLPPVPGDRFRGQVTLDQVTLNGVKNHPWIRPALPSLSSISKAGASHFQLNLETFQVWKEMLFVYCRMCFFFYRLELAAELQQDSTSGCDPLGLRSRCQNDISSTLNTP